MVRVCNGEWNLLMLREQQGRDLCVVPISMGWHWYLYTTRDYCSWSFMSTGWWPFGVSNTGRNPGRGITSECKFCTLCTVLLIFFFKFYMTQKLLPRFTLYVSSTKCSGGLYPVYILHSLGLNHVPLRLLMCFHILEKTSKFIFKHFSFGMLYIYCI